eukprot:Trichotokara_eunicae@DN2515_c0_g1_i1.p1
MSLWPLIIVGALWGCTAPFIKKGSGSYYPEVDTSVFQRVLTHVFYLARRWQFLIPFIINQSGSILFQILLGSSAMSITIPVVNGLAVLFTLMTEALLFRSCPNLGTITGACLMLVGIYFTQKG